MTSSVPSTKIKLAAFVSTNVPGASINELFLSRCSAMLAKMFHTADELVTLEIRPDVPMIRAGSTTPMMNVQIFHNSDLVVMDKKKTMAETFAAWTAKELKVPKDRVLVLFLDTRRCNAT